MASRPQPTTDQLLEIIKEQPPAWEFDPPQREEFPNEFAYLAAMFRYARRVFAARQPPLNSFEVIEEDALVGGD